MNYLNIFTHHALFCKLSEDALRLVIKSLQKEVYLPNDIVIKSGRVAHYLYFILHGTVAVLTPLGKEVCHLKDGDYFGEIGLLSENHLRTADIIAIELCSVYSLEESILETIIQEQPDIKEQLLETSSLRLKMTQTVEDQYKKFLYERMVATRLSQANSH